MLIKLLISQKPNMNINKKKLLQQTAPTTILQAHICYEALHTTWAEWISILVGELRGRLWSHDERDEFATNVPIGDDALRDLTHKDEEQDEGEQPAQVVTGKVEPGAVVDVDLRTLAAPASNRKWNRQSYHTLKHRKRLRRPVETESSEVIRTDWKFLE